MNIFDESIESVTRRGFHDAPLSAAFEDGHLMRQYTRLVEEVGEVGRALRGKGSVTSEVADVVITCANVLHVYGVSGAEMEAIISMKLASDEQRGHLHNGTN